MADASIARRTLPRVQWSAVLAGAFFAVATHVVLGLFGFAAGLRATPADPSRLGWGALAWGVGMSFFGSLAGGFVAARGAWADSRRSAILHALLAWSVGLVAGALFLSSTLAGGTVMLAAGEMGPEALAAVFGIGGIAAISGLFGAALGGLAGSTRAARERRVVRESATDTGVREAGYQGYHLGERGPAPTHTIPTRTIPSDTTPAGRGTSDEGRRPEQRGGLTPDDRGLH